MAWFLIECFLWRLIMIIIKISYQRIVEKNVHTESNEQNSIGNRTNGRLRLLLTICQTHTRISNINKHRIDTAKKNEIEHHHRWNETRGEQANKRTRIVALSFSFIPFYFAVWDFSSCFMALIALQSTHTRTHANTRTNDTHTRFVTLNGFYDANRFSVVVTSSRRFFLSVVNGWYFNFNHRFEQHFMVIIELRATETNSQ